MSDSTDIVSELIKARVEIGDLKQRVRELEQQLASAHALGAKAMQEEAMRVLAPSWDKGAANVVASIHLPVIP